MGLQIFVGAPFLYSRSQYNPIHVTQIPHPGNYQRLNSINRRIARWQTGQKIGAALVFILQSGKGR